ncbi:MlaC/ttg2D family ABC transporter substrate-binding protein [endosymbiont of Ridgeia piscesae]|uniref:ABC-type transporter Mla maintaining outer membrane lipid asymmetry, periplasmic MlaC component n=1 Tax=endosymbiont of Ridgeia piscesae TaxID=54398 RepID=A0A0T5YSV5_9GAMM|nr:ABC transporter substrate-binding protein [endosymbiont of Ridgeia piscesae]KRT53698.1 ABC-type transporter Mla maintaining outer membrane lipid asymmetry, periplasmic MlaC component [endosymbiont of Ridgeia piscesae]KRT57067.1 phospholipid transport system substrate-binding protein [endosymbiont of Ridgeia piscesae]
MRWTLYSLLFLLITVSASAEEGISPTERVTLSMDAVMQVLNNPNLNREQRRLAVRDVVRSHFDYRVMSRIILAINWRKATDEQRDRFERYFRELMENTYFSAIDNYSGEEVRIGREKRQGKRAVVQTMLITKSKQIPIDFKLLSKSNDWAVYDVVIEGVSLISNYRVEYRGLVKREGMEGLLYKLERKALQLKKGAKTDTVEPAS